MRPAVGKRLLYVRANNYAVAFVKGKNDNKVFHDRGSGVLPQQQVRRGVIHMQNLKIETTRFVLRPFIESDAPMVSYNSK